MIPPEIQTLITRKQKADALAPEIRQKYAEKYNQVVAELAHYGLDHSLPHWDEEVNSLILLITFWDMGQKYLSKGPYVEWMCAAMIPEVDESFQARDQSRFERCTQTARKQLGNV